jgi:hypothetical protein
MEMMTLVIGVLFGALIADLSAEVRKKFGYYIKIERVDLNGNEFNGNDR